MTFFENLLIDQGITYKTQGLKGQCNVMVPVIGRQEYHFLEGYSKPSQGYFCRLFFDQIKVQGNIFQKK